MTVLVPPDANKRGGARPGWNGGLYAFMRRALATDRGGALYAKRRVMIEPVFADTKFNRRHRPLLTPRPGRSTLGMAADQRRPQPAQALATHHSARGGLTAAAR